MARSLKSSRALFVQSAVLACLAAVFTPSLHAQTCPFDTGGSDAVNDGVVLTRYALGITGAPLTASTRYASLDPLQVKANIECVGCALDVNQDGVVDTIDTTVIARHLAGFNGAAVTNGLGLTPAVAASVTSFLANGCAVGGAINAFVQGGNTFALGAGIASVLGNNDNRPLSVQAPQSTIKLLVDPVNGDDGLRISYANGGFSSVSPNTINGSRVNSVGAGVFGATIAGGGLPSSPNTVTASLGTVGGGIANNVSDMLSVIGGGEFNAASGYASVVPGGSNNTAAGDRSFAAGRRAKANHNGAFVWGDNTAAEVASTGDNQFVIRAGGGMFLNTPSVQFGPTANVHAAGGEESLRITRGHCNCIIATPTIPSGSGVTVTRTAVGKFAFTFTTPFAGIPTVTLTIFLPPGGAGYTTVLTSFSATGFTAETYLGATLTDAPFTFIAIGPR